MAPAFRTVSIRLNRSCLILRFSTTTSTIQSQSASLSKSSSRLPMVIRSASFFCMSRGGLDISTASRPALTIRFLAFGSLFLLLRQVKGNDVQQQGLDAGTGQKRGDAAAHDPGADDRCRTDFSSHNDLLYRLGEKLT